MPLAPQRPCCGQVQSPCAGRPIRRSRSWTLPPWQDTCSRPLWLPPSGTSCSGYFPWYRTAQISAPSVWPRRSATDRAGSAQSAFLMGRERSAQNHAMPIIHVMSNRAQVAGFEPARVLPPPHYQYGAFGHSATPPRAARRPHGDHTRKSPPGERIGCTHRSQAFRDVLSHRSRLLRCR